MSKRWLRVPGPIWLLSISAALCALWACNLPLWALHDAGNATAAPQPTGIPANTFAPFQTLPPIFTPTPAPPTATHTAAPPTPTPTATFTPTARATPLTKLLRGPLIQSVTLDSVFVLWDTDRKVIGDAVYGETVDLGSRQNESEGTRRHEVQISGLTSHTTYHYRVEAPDGPLSEDASFRTAARPEDPFSFAVFGDTQRGHDSHQLIADRVLSLAPDFILHTGDLVSDGDSKAEWDTFFAIEQALLQRIPLYPTLGNHENQSSLYFDQFHLPGNERWYAFNYGNARFICIEVDEGAAYDPSSDQYAWLEAALADNTQTWLIVYFHVPPYTGSQEDAAEAPKIRDTLSPLFIRYGVDLVLNGHHHNYQHFLVDGVNYVVTGGGGGSMHQVSASEPGLVAFAVQHHFMYVNVEGAILTAKALSVDGETLDEFRLEPHRPPP